VRKHGGRTLVSSRVGIGSVFRVYLPAAPENPAGVEKAETPAASFPSSKEGFILVMDDEEIIRHMAEEMLSLLGYRVETFSSGEEVVEGYRNALDKGARPDVVIMDLTVPGRMGGMEASAAILEIDPAASLIVSSGYSSDPVLANFRDYGFSDAMAKPFRVEDLGAVIRRVIGRKLFDDAGPD
ncbi:MAG: response regulator, partial [Geobacteraceae bacterium]|nr:response regulator [Geobacteraceae bacterium]